MQPRLKSGIFVRALIRRAEVAGALFLKVSRLDGTCTVLGQALVKALAAMHGGEATIESTLGVGTTVNVRLPYAAVDEKGARVMPIEAKIIPFKGAA